MSARKARRATRSASLAAGMSRTVTAREPRRVAKSDSRLARAVRSLDRWTCPAGIWSRPNFGALDERMPAAIRAPRDALGQREGFVDAVHAKVGGDEGVREHVP